MEWYRIDCPERQYAVMDISRRKSKANRHAIAFFPSKRSLYIRGIDGLMIPFDAPQIFIFFQSQHPEFGKDTLSDPLLKISVDSAA
ncbi:hypothetical protein [Oligoflexus tunisiensis]|uniref:hypothetical protein n=1 Tax=Oligoflexus tunisiensis TaxID=708132 RepID=UPI001C4048D3|nr:hypothetical protein [Oligoflexus tunisiensis]